MFKTNDMVLYGSEGVCEIEGKTEREFKGEQVEYYILKPIDNVNSTIFIPTQNEDLVKRMKMIMTECEIEEMIENVSEENLKWTLHDNSRRDMFKSIIKSGDRSELLRLIRTIHMKQEELKDNGKRLHVVDLGLFKEAQKMLHDEMAYVLEIESEDVSAYISSKMKELKM